MIVKPNITSILYDILLNKLGSDYIKRIWSYNSKGMQEIVNNSQDYKRFIVIERTGDSPMAQTKEYKYNDGINPTLQAIQQIINIQNITIQVCSRTDLQGNIEAEKYTDVLFAFNSDYCYQKQLEYGINIPQTPISIVNATAAETTQLITRFDLNFQITNWEMDIQDVAFYDRFTAELKYLEK